MTHPTSRTSSQIPRKRYLHTSFESSGSKRGCIYVWRDIKRRLRQCDKCHNSPPARANADFRRPASKLVESRESIQADHFTIASVSWIEGSRMRLINTLSFSRAAPVLRMHGFTCDCATRIARFGVVLPPQKSTPAPITTPSDPAPIQSSGICQRCSLGHCTPCPTRLRQSQLPKAIIILCHRLRDQRCISLPLSTNFLAPLPC